MYFHIVLDHFIQLPTNVLVFLFTFLYKKVKNVVFFLLLSFSGRGMCEQHLAEGEVLRAKKQAAVEDCRAALLTNKRLQTVPFYI